MKNNYMGYIDDYLTIKEVNRLIDSIPNVAATMQKKRPVLPPEILQLLLKIIYHGMLRVEEATFLQKKDFDFHEKEIILRQPRTGLRQCHCHGSDKNCSDCGGTGKYYEPEKAVFGSEHLWKEIQHHLKDLQSDQYLFYNKGSSKPITRSRVHSWVKYSAEFSKINKNANLETLRDSRAHHLRITRILTETEIHQMYRGSKSQFSGSFVPSQNRYLLECDKKANLYLRTYCESCKFKNPDEAFFCCICSHSLSEEKTILN